MGVRDTRGGWLLVMACLLAGCSSSSGTVTERSASGRSKTSSQTAAQRCAMSARLGSGAAFPGWHMGAVQFFSAASGIGVTAENFPCYRPGRGGNEVGLQRQSVRLAVTYDGGRWWQVTGATLPIGPARGGVVAEQLVATSPAEVWALVGKGRLLATRDGGADWQAQRIPSPVAEVAAGAGFVWALSCSHAASRLPLACTPQLWRTRSANSPWIPVQLPRVTAQAPSYVQFAITANGSAIIQILNAGSRQGGELFISHDAGVRWIRRPDPSWDHIKCDRDAGAILTAAPTRSLWLLCTDNGAAGSSTKGLLRSSDTGQTWTTVSAAKSLTQRPRPGSIPLEEPSALAASSQTRLWLSLTNDLAQSSDGGRHWNSVPGVVNTSGWTTVFDVLSASHVWLLAPGAGLWRTTDGLHWGAVGPLNTN